MKIKFKTILTLFLLLLTITPGLCKDEEGVKITKIWNQGQNPMEGGPMIDTSSPIIYLSLVNYDEYQQNVKVVAEWDDITWESPYIPLSPNKHIEKIIELKPQFTEIGDNKVDIDLINDDGENIGSKSITVDVRSPMDVKYINCSGSYTEENKKTLEYCTGNWFTITLKSNPYAQSDYEVVTWISAVSTDYDEDSSESEEEDNEDVYYNGVNDKKTIYMSLNSEKEVSFRVPRIESEDEQFKIQVHTQTMGLHSYTTNEQETIKKKVGNYITYDLKETKKSFSFPIILNDFEVLTKINDSYDNLLRDYYNKYKIQDEEILDYLNKDRYGNSELIPRAYLKNEKYPVIIKLNYTNYYDEDLEARIKIKDENENIQYNELCKFEESEYSTKYILLNLLPDKNKIDISTELKTLSGYYINNLEEDADEEYIEVPPITITDVEFPYDKDVQRISNHSGNILVGKTYPLKLTVKNMYNKTISGTLELSDEFIEGAVNYSEEEIKFELSAHETKTYTVNVKFNREINGDISAKVIIPERITEDDHELKLHFNVFNIFQFGDMNYNNTVLPRATVIGNNGGLFVPQPVAGFENELFITLRNKLSVPVDCTMQIETYDLNGKLRAQSDIINTELKPGYSTIDYETFNFKINYEEGFSGYTLLRIKPHDEFKDFEYCYFVGSTSNIYPQMNAKIGRFSNIDVLSRIKSNTVESTTVLAPINIYDFEAHEEGLSLKLSSGLVIIYPVDLNFEYWISIYKDDEKIHDTIPKNIYLHSMEVKPITLKFNEKLKDGNEYKIEINTKIPDFVSVNGVLKPVTLKKSIKIKYENGKNSIVEEKEETSTINNRYEIQNNNEETKDSTNRDNMENQNTNTDVKTTSDVEENQDNSSDDMVSNIFNSITGAIKSIPIIGGLIN
ncbi:hypothetical protein M2325_000058 [Methanococcus voltae PS]|uniref:Uncharacterized protein n=2 Tax=Methanococcus voltae TaxID=2188 RepID=Q2EMS8_METVO|nr:hypothetical protein [Methanococcus voltae]ABD17756.1 hypothetical protein MVO0251 [Methanococcus voltae PS]MCS3921385.1 hypothetical protein [Methanococcus voltae PS]